MAPLPANALTKAVFVCALGLIWSTGCDAAKFDYNGKIIDIRPKFFRPHCGDDCILKNLIAADPDDCGKKCVDTEGCRSAIFRKSDGYCSLKNKRLYAPEMKIIYDMKKNHVAIRVISKYGWPQWSPTPGPAPRPSPGPYPVPSPTPQPAPKPAPQPASQPAPQPAPQPAAKPAPAPTPKPVPAPQPTPAPKNSGGSTGGGFCDDGEIRSALDYQNEVRARYNHKPLKCNEKLSQISFDWSKSMCDTDTLEHGDWSNRISGGGFHGAMGENAAYRGYAPGHGKEVAKQWEDSAGHFCNMVNPAYEEIGLGYFNCPQHNKVYWTEDLVGCQASSGCAAVPQWTCPK